MTLLVDLKKKAQISLEKKNIFGEKAEVVLVIDTSASMGPFYKNGSVQKVVERLIGLAMNMDDNQEIDVIAFDDRSHEIAPANPGNVEGFVDNILLKKIKLGAGTRYANPIKEVIQKFGVEQKQEKKGFFGKLFGKEEAPEPKKIPTYVLFVTDGDNQDKLQTETIMREASKQGIFWQFVGIGKEKFNFLQKLDDLTERFIDNADFFKLNDFNSISDEELYDRILTEFPTWLKEAREKGIIA
jgi:uncharacterized protein YegL